MKAVFSLPTKALMLGLLLSAANALAAPGPSEAEPAEEPLKISRAALAERFGIRLEALRVSAAGHMLDLRYRITDAEKARALMTEWRPFIVDEASGRKLSTPSFAKVGALRQSPERLQEGRTYFVLFANPGRNLGPEDTVTLALEGIRVEGVPAE